MNEIIENKTINELIIYVDTFQLLNKSILSLYSIDILEHSSFHKFYMYLDDFSNRFCRIVGTKSVNKKLLLDKKSSTALLNKLNSYYDFHSDFQNIISNFQNAILH